MAETITIGSHKIGKGFPCFIIAEAGSNWRISPSQSKNFKQALKLIDITAYAKADAVKFQLFGADKLYPKNAGQADYLGKTKSIYKIIEEMQMPYDWLAKLKKHCQQKGIIFLCTPFDEQSAVQLEKIGMPAYKIASYGISHLPLLKYIAKFDKPIILSTGASEKRDIRKAIKAIKRAGNNQILLNQCTAKYPAPLSTLNLKVIPELKKEFKTLIGLSDHSREPIIGALGAVALGVDALEKHFTTSNNLPGPDHQFSILPNELALMVEKIREMEIALGRTKKYVLPEEKELYHFCRRMVFSRRDIAQGEKFSKDNTIILRPGKQFNKAGVLAEDWFELFDKRANKFIKKDCLIKKSDLSGAQKNNFKIRRAQKKDSLALWQIRNEKSVRMVSNNTEKIRFSDHQNWFKSYLADKKNHFFVLEYKRKVIGYCRYAFEKKNTYAASIALKPSYRGRGLGSYLLSGTIKKLPSKAKVLAETRANNKASRSLFENNRFEVYKKTKNKFFLHFVRS